MYISKFTTSKNGNQYFMVKIFEELSASFRPVDRHEIVKDKSVLEELNAQLVSLLG